MTTIDSDEISLCIRQVGQVNSRVARIRAEAGEPGTGSDLCDAVHELEDAVNDLRAAFQELRAQQELPVPAAPGTGALVLGRHSVEEVLAHVTRTAQRALPGTQVSVTLRPEGRRPVQGLDDSPAGGLTALQHRLGEGPTLDALASGLPVRADLARDRRWPRFARAALGRGTRCVLAEPLSTGEEPIGVLTVYGDGAGRAGGRAAAEVARTAAATLQDALTICQLRRLVAELSQALTSRAVIDQARGIIMAQSGCTEEEAFDRLRTASQRENVKLRHLAERLVESARTHAGRRR